MTGPVLSFLGETLLELGPAANAKAKGNWRLAKGDDGIAWLVLDREGNSVNTISAAVIGELAAHLDALEKDMPKALVIRSAKRAGFAAGADISEFKDLAASGKAETLLHDAHKVLDRLAALPCPTIAVVHGHTLGGGFELALACDHRIAVMGAKFAFPEVMLGLHPGLGGTFRLTALIDPVEAMTLMLTGKTAHTSKAKKLGIIDVVTEERHVANTVRAVAQGQVRNRDKGLKERALGLDMARSIAARRMRAETEKRVSKAHYPAPYALIDLWEEHGGNPHAMQRGEIASFVKLLETKTAQNLIRVFFLQQGLKADAGGAPSGISHVHVIGGGAMGADIAAWSALRGKTVTLEDIDTAPLGRAVARAIEVAKEAHLTGVETRNALDRLMPDPKGYGVAQADLVIEAVPENIELKGRIYAGLKGRMKKGAILATNTSSLPLAELAGGAPVQTRFAGLHFFNPVNRMQLIEVVGHKKTAKAVLDQLAAFCGEIGRLPARVADYPGFLVNRALTPYVLEAMLMIEEGIAKSDIDRTAEEFGMPMGPVELADRVGLDICLAVADSMAKRLDKPLAEVPQAMRKKVESGITGQKSGKGNYDWVNGKPQKPAGGNAPGGEITDRLILPMLDACVECLRLKVIADCDKLDAAMIFATGFAPFRGGPMHYVQTEGAANIKGRLQALAERHGPRFAPDKGWDEV